MVDKRIKKQTFSKRVKRLDTFISTYMRCFQPKETLRIMRHTNLLRFASSLARGPLVLIGVAVFPFELLYSPWPEVPFVFKIPEYLILYGALKQAFTASIVWMDYRYKQNIYLKYKDEMEITKQQIEELEAEDQEVPKIESK